MKKMIKKALESFPIALYNLYARRIDIIFKNISGNNLFFFLIEPCDLRAAEYVKWLNRNGD